MSTPEAARAGLLAAAADRRRTRRARTTARACTTRAGTGRRWHLMWLLVGPGILAMLGENDGPSMIAYAADGAQYGLGFFVPFIPLLFAMAYVCQEMCMRVGAVTHRGYGELVLQRYGPRLGLVRRRRPDAHEPRHAGRRVRRDPRRARLLPPRLGRRRRARPGARRCSRSAAGATGAGSASCSAWPLFNGLFLRRRDPRQARTSARSRSSLDFTPFPGGSFNTLLLLLASTIGATVTPWMIFFQQSASADKGMTPRDIRHGRYDTALGAVLAAIFGVGALIAGAALLDRTTAPASRGSPAPASRRRCSTSRAAPRAPCSRSG